MSIRQDRVIAIVGPTGVGKSEVAYLLAKRLDGEIISADSMLVYEGMDIGTAKPSLGYRKRVPHHLIDIVPVEHDFTVAEYQERAREAIGKIQEKGKSALLVGGSGLYVRAVIDDLEFPPKTKESQLIRKSLYKKVEEEGTQALVEQLEKVDKRSVEQIDSHNVRRLIRAIEVWETTGQPYSVYQNKWEEYQPIYSLVMVGVIIARVDLYRELDIRVDKMVEKGLFSEVEQLVSQGYRHALTSKQAIGYKEILAYLDGTISKKEAIQKIKQTTHHLSKRQLTWFKRDPRIIWFEREKHESAKSVADRIESFIRAEERACHNRAGRVKSGR